MNLELITASKLPSLLLVALCSSFIITFVSGQDVPCIVHDCGCLCKNASGTFEISMKGVSNPGGPPRFNDVPDANTHSWEYDINPCNEFSELDMCEGVTMCQKSKPDPPTAAFPVAKLSIKSCGNYEEGKPLTVTYEKYVFSKDMSLRQMIIKLVYGSPVYSEVKQSMSAENIELYILTITDPSLKPQESTEPSSGGSSSAGDEGLSSGTAVIVIIFAVVLVVYLIAGIIFMKYVRGEDGKEFKSNVDFGSTLPRIIKVQYENGHSRNLEGTCTTM